MNKQKEKPKDLLEVVALKTTRWIGSTSSILIHTAFFIVSFVLYWFGVAMDDILLILTTVVSLEAIYLAIFIQMTVNRQGTSLREVAEDIDEIQEDIDEIQEDLDDDEIEEAKEDIALNRIENTLSKLIEEVVVFKKYHNSQIDSPKIKNEKNN